MRGCWTERVVEFTPYPRTPDAAWEAFFEAAADHYYERPAAVRRFLEPLISSSGQIVSVTGIPRWMPGWWARRAVANIAAECGVGGSARFVVERAVA